MDVDKPELSASVSDLQRKRDLLMQQKKEKEEQLANLLKSEKVRPNKNSGLKRSRSKKGSDTEEAPKKKVKKDNGEPSEKKSQSKEGQEKSQIGTYSGSHGS